MHQPSPGRLLLLANHPSPLHVESGPPAGNFSFTEKYHKSKLIKTEKPRASPGLMIFLHLVSAGETSLVAQWQRICLPMQETWVPSLGWEDPLEQEVTTHSSILAWKIPWTENPGSLQSMESQKSET